MPMPTSSIGEWLPDVTMPPPSIVIPCRGIAFSVITNATSFCSGPSALIRRSSSTPGELRVERARPAEPGRDRVGVRRDVVAVQRVADLEPQRVARAEPARLRAARDDRVPERRRVLGRTHQLDAALARVAGAVDHHLDAVELAHLPRERLARPGRPSRSSERGPCTASSAYSSEKSRTSEPGISRSLSQR